MATLIVSFLSPFLVNFLIYISHTVALFRLVNCIGIIWLTVHSNLSWGSANRSLGVSSWLEPETLAQYYFGKPLTLGFGPCLVSLQFVSNCAQSFTTDQDLLDARRELDNITAAAISRSVEELEANEDVCDFGVKMLKNKVEKRMYISPWYVIDHHSQEDFYPSFGIEVHFPTLGNFPGFVLHSTKTFFQVYGFDSSEIRFKHLGISQR